MRLCNCIFTLSRQSRADSPRSVRRQTGSAAYFKGDKTQSYIVLHYFSLRLARPPPHLLPIASLHFVVQRCSPLGSVPLHLTAQSGAWTMTVCSLLRLLRKFTVCHTVFVVVQQLRRSVHSPEANITAMQDQHS